MADLSVDLHDALVAFLEAHTPLTDLLGSDKVFGWEWDTRVEWPYVRLGVFIAGPFNDGCWTGIDADFAVHGFANGRNSAKVAADIGAEIEAALTDVQDESPSVSLPSGTYLSQMDWTGTQVVSDPAEASAHHVIVNFSARVVRDA